MVVCPGFVEVDAEYHEGCECEDGDAGEED